MKMMVEFTKTLFANGVGLAVWMSLLLLANMVVPLFFFVTIVEGQLVLVAFVASAFSMMAIFASKGFVRLLGLGHVYWVPLVPWLWTRLPGFPPDDPFAMWIAAAIILNQGAVAALTNCPSSVPRLAQASTCCGYRCV